MSSNDRCIAHLESGGLLLTSDLRQARILRRLHDRAQIVAGRTVWPSAQVLPLDAWLAGQWREACQTRGELPEPLAPIALRWLWRRAAEPDAPELLDAAELGARARSSWLRLRAHGSGLDELARFPLTRDQQAFMGWARSAERDLRERNACDGADLARLIVAHDALPDPGPPLLLAGFRRPLPAQLALFDAFARRGWQVTQLGAPSAVGAAWRHAAVDPDAERAAMLAWVRGRLDEQPDGIHGLIIADLAVQRGAIERALAAALQPELEVPGAGRERVFDIAGGRPLHARPIIESALDAVRCAFGRADWTVVTRLLRSAHLHAGVAEREARARLDVSLRKAQGGFPPALADEARRSLAPRFADALGRAAEQLAGPERRSAAAWAESFGNCLAAWGWPGEAVLDAADWQAANRLRELLHELAALASTAPSLGVDAAFAQLQALAAAPFQPESGEPAVFVMDTLEDPGLGYDSLWVAGLTAAAWPRPVAVDPLLPIEAQRLLGMPGATAGDCVADARSIVAAWRARAGALVLSWPCRENDTDIDGSPLVPAELPAVPPPAPLLARERLACGSIALEPFADEVAPALGSDKAHGGARVLELQSQCPFRAFGELRLRAAALEEPQAGIDRRIRGQVLHDALERLWAELGSQQALLALDAASCEQRVAKAVDGALARAAPNAARLRSLRLEREWQLQAIAGLLELERARAPFTVVETERELQGDIGGLRLRMRVDRVDETAGGLVVIDYKTGAVRGAPWRGARMDAPQLPLYAVLHARKPTGIAIAQVGTGRTRFVGVGAEAAVFDGLLPATEFVLTEERACGFDWSQVTEHWWAWLDRLARDHAAGRADVDPKLGASTCRSCHLSALCRVEPASVEDEEPEEQGDGRSDC